MLTLTVLFGLISAATCQNTFRQKCSEYKTLQEKFPIFPNRINTGHIHQYATDSEYPHMAVLGYLDDQNQTVWSCGGSLITDQYVLTAAHCAVAQFLNEVTTVRLGTIHKSKPGKDYKDYSVEKIIVHPKFNKALVYNDIALLKLKEKVEFRASILPACVNLEKDLSNLTFVTLGWGRTSFTGDQSDFLKKVELVPVSREECQKSYDKLKRRIPEGIVDDLHVCASDKEGRERGACQGDSGGPLEYTDGTTHYIAGVSSFGYCGLGGAPGVYVRVSSYVPWMESEIWP